MDGRWDHYVYFGCPYSGIETSIRCAGIRTAEAIAQQKREQGYWRVRIVHRRFSRHKEPHSHVSHGVLRRLHIERAN